MSHGDQIRSKIFTAYSSNIKILCRRMGWQVGLQEDNGGFKEVSNPYICPICGLLFQKESLDQKLPNPLTLEDVPPEKLGGNPIILTCKNCNNKLGGNQLDSKLIWDLEIEPFRKKTPNSKIKAYYEINKRTKAKGELVFVERNKFGLHFNPGTNPNLNKELDYLVKNWNKSTIRFSIQAPNKRIVHLALLRIAYLKMIAKFGYGYYFNASSQVIRKQLFDINKDIIPDFGIPSFDSIPVDKKGIHFIKSPRELQSFLVIFDIQLNKTIKTYSVLIPGPEENCINLYSNLKENKKFQLDLVPIQESDLLEDENKILSYNEIWNYYSKNYEC